MKKTADKPNMPKMPRPSCKKDNSVLETELKLAAEHRMIDVLTIHETEQGYYLTVKFMDMTGKVMKPTRHASGWQTTLEPFIGDRYKLWYLTSRHHRTSPRLHKSLGRLNELMRTKFPTNSVILLRDQYLPGTPRIRGRPSKSGDKADT